MTTVVRLGQASLQLSRESSRGADAFVCPAFHELSAEGRVCDLEKNCDPTMCDLWG